MTTEDTIDIRLEELRNEIARLEKEKSKLTKASVLSVFKEGHYYVIRINQERSIFFKFTKENVQLKKADTYVVVRECLIHESGLLESFYGLKHNHYLPVEYFDRNSIRRYVIEDIGEQQFNAIIDDHIRQLERFRPTNPQVDEGVYV